MKNVFLIAISLLFVGNISMAQTSSTSDLNAILKNGNWSSDIDNGFIIVSKDGYEKGVIGTNGNWIIKPEIESETLEIAVEPFDVYEGKVPNLKTLLGYTRMAINGNNVTILCKLFANNGDVLLDKTYTMAADRNKVWAEEKKIQKEMYLFAINYSLNSNFTLQNLPMTEKFRISTHDDGHPNLLQDGYLIFTNDGESYNVIDRTGKIVIEKKDGILYCGNNTFSVRDINQYNRYFIKVK